MTDKQIPEHTPQWQPIDTAPKDGTSILLGRFTGNPKEQHEGLQAVDWYRTPAKDAGFIGFGKFNAQYWPPTHWMPLPPPPAKVKR